MNYKEEVLKYLDSKYEASDITQKVDDEVYSGNWVNSEDVEDSDCDDEYEYYQEHCNGEAENAVCEELVNEVLEHLDITEEQYEESVGEELYETIQEKYPELESN